MEIKDLPQGSQSLANMAINSMKSGNCLAVKYHGEERVIEVHAVGLSTKGRPVIRAYQVTGGSVFSEKTGWKMLALTEIEDAILMQDFPFHAPRPGYNPGDRGMSHIIAEISDEAVPPEPKSPEG